MKTDPLVWHRLVPILVAFGLAIAFVWMRGDLPLPWQGLFGTLALTLTLVLVPARLLRLSPKPLDRAQLLACEAAFAGLLLGGLALLPRQEALSVAGLALLLLVAASALVAFLIELGRTRPPAFLPSLGLALLLTAWLASSHFMGGWTSAIGDDFVDPAEHVTDAWFHAAVTAMIQTHDQSSTGLDGLRPLHYYTLSHRLNARLGELLGVSAIASAGIFGPLLFTPLWVYGLLLAARALEARFFPERPARGEIAALALFLFLVTTPFGPWMPRFAFLQSLLTSPSYGLGMAFLGWWWTVVLAWRSLGRGIDSFLTPAAVALTFAVGASKTSLIVVCLPALCTLFLLGARPGERVEAVARCFVVGTVGLATYFFYAPLGVVPLELDFLSFLFNYIPVRFWPLWPFAYFLTTWIALLALRRRIGSWRAFLEPEQRDPALLALTLALIAFVGVMPGMLVYMQGFSAIFFSEISWFLSGLALMALVRVAPPQLSGRRRLLGQGLVLLISAMVLWQGVRQTQASVFGRNQALSTITTGLPDSSWPAVHHELRNLAKLPHAEKVTGALWIPRGNRAYWSTYLRLFVSFLAPTISGMACIDHLPQQLSGLNFPYYGYADYLPAQKPFPEPDAEAQAVARARALGFERLYVLEIGEAGPSTRIIALR